MNPIDAPLTDRRLYYHNTWMRHLSGIGQVKVSEDNELLFYNLLTEVTAANAFGINFYLVANPVYVPPESLQCWWPRAGAHNTPLGAVYITRTTIRAMHKSAMPETHYKIKGGDEIPPYAMMWALDQEFPRIPIMEAVARLQNHEVVSIAINRDIILKQGLYTQIHVFFRGSYVGDYQNGEFIPSFEGAPISKRILFKLLNQEI